jgi:hypothetical protein
VEFEKNHRGENDVALFDFTSLFASENAARIIERKGKRILLCVAGDSLLEVSTFSFPYGQKSCRMQCNTRFLHHNYVHLEHIDIIAIINFGLSG